MKVVCSPASQDGSAGWGVTIPWCQTQLPLDISRSTDMICASFMQQLPQQPPSPHHTTPTLTSPQHSKILRQPSTGLPHPLSPALSNSCRCCFCDTVPNHQLRLLLLLRYCFETLGLKYLSKSLHPRVATTKPTNSARRYAMVEAVSTISCMNPATFTTCV